MARLTLQGFITVLILGTITWSIIFSIGYGRLAIYLPYPLPGMGGAEWIGFVIGWVLICFLPGIPLLLILKRASKSFKEFVEPPKKVEKKPTRCELCHKRVSLLHELETDKGVKLVCYECLKKATKSLTEGK